MKDVEIISKIYGYTYIFRDIKCEVSVYLVKADISEKIKLREKAIVDFVWQNPETAIKILKWENERNCLKIASKKIKSDA